MMLLLLLLLLMSIYIYGDVIATSEISKKGEGS